jgi:hypothetical protein
VLSVKHGRKTGVGTAILTGLTRGACSEAHTAHVSDVARLPVWEWVDSAMAANATTNMQSHVPKHFAIPSFLVNVLTVTSNDKRWERINPACNLLDAPTSKP